MTEKQQPTARPRQWPSYRSILRWGFWFFSSAILIASIAAAAWLYRLDDNIKARFAQKRFAPPVEFFSAPERVIVGSSWPAGYFERLLTQKNYRRREFGQPIQAADFSIWSGEQCLTVVGPQQPTPDTASASTPAPTLTSCVVFRSVPSPESNVEQPVQIIAVHVTGETQEIAALYSGVPPQPVATVQLQPELFAQYYGDTPILRQVVDLGAVPTHCLNALLATEDAKFLDHPGVSFTGLARAVWTVMRPGRRAQGGSTITQQLVKNYFLTDERTLKRKLTEIPMAFLVERHATKDEILETYINLIYMGQNGPFQVRGFAAASEHYFGRPLSDLNLPQCALLVGVLNNPGLFNPFVKPENAIKRRAIVLDRMLAQNMISEDLATAGKAEALPLKPNRVLTEPAPYFVQSVRRDLRERGIDDSEGLRVYTTLNLRAQETAHQAIRSGLDHLETSILKLKKLKEQGKNLEAVLLSADPQTGEVQAMVGGRGYVFSQFNRATDSRRQVGSVMKPFVYLTAFELQMPDGKPYTPLSPVDDTSVTHRYEGQTWTPHNYEAVYNGKVPIFYALKESLNAATANLGIGIGLSNIIDTARRLGISSNIDPVPALTLGAFELSPMEVLTAYSAFAHLGQRMPLTLMRRVERPDGSVLFSTSTLQPEQVVASDSVSELVGVMKQTLISGTAKAARAAGFLNPAAGKTGTTNDKKDAWFAGFTPYHAAVVWVGYDDNTPHGLTGGSGAVPIWTDYMKRFAASFPADDFPWPDSVEKVLISPDEQIRFGVPASESKNLAPVELIFKKGQVSGLGLQTTPIGPNDGR